VVSASYKINIVWVECSPRPRVSEVTYVPRGEVREYDWFVILRICDERSNKCINVPLLLEELSLLYEFGGKIAMDKLLGVGIPVIFIRGREPYLGPALSQGAYPAVIDLSCLLHDLCKLGDTLGRLSIFTELLEPEFWDELMSARLFYSPSIYVNFVLRPLVEIASLYQSYSEDDLVDLYWKVLELKAENEILAFSGVITNRKIVDYNLLVRTISQKYLDKKCIGTLKGAINELRHTLEEAFDLCNSDVVIIHVPLFTLRAVIPEEEMLKSNFKVNIHPVFESLISVALLLGYIIKDSRRVIIIVHTDECEIRDGSRMWFVEEWVIEKIRAILSSYGFDNPNLEVMVYLWSKMFRYLRKQDVEKYLESLYEGILGTSLCRICNIIIVRDTAKGFLYNLVEILRKKGKVFLIYVPEELRIFIDNLPDELRIKTDMPTRGILLSKDGENVIPRENKDEKQLYEKCREKGYFKSFGSLIFISSILDSFIDI